VAISVLQEVHNENPSGGGSATTIAVTLTVAAGSALHVYVMENANGSGGSITLSDNLGQTYTQSSAVTDASRIARDFYLIGAAAGSTTITATMSLGAFVAGIWVKEIGQCSGYQSGSGQLQLSPGAGTDAVTSNTATPTSQPALVSGFTFGDNNADTTVAGTGFTTGLNTWPLFGAGLVGLSEHLRVTSTSAIAATYTATAGGASNRWKTVVAIFTEGAAAASAVPFTRQQQYALAEEPPPQQRRARLIAPAAVATQVPFSRAAQQQALQQWAEAPSGVLLPRRLVRPTLPVMSGLKLWLRGDLGTAISAGNVTQWDDQSGNGNHVTGSIPFNASSINGRPGLTFSAAGMTNGSSSVLAGASPRTVFVVYKATNNNPQSSLVTLRSGTLKADYTAEWAFAGAGLIYTDGVNGANNAFVPLVGNASVATIAEWTSTAPGAVLGYRRNGVALVVTQTSGSSTENGTAGFSIGGSGAALGPMLGDIDEVIVFDRVLSAGEEALVQEYLSVRYSISLFVPPFFRLAQIGTALRSWDPELAPRFDRRFAPQGIVVAPDSPIPGWNRRVSNLIARQAWEAPDVLPQLPVRPTSNYPAPPPPLSRTALLSALAQWEPALVPIVARRLFPGQPPLPDNPPLGRPRLLTLLRILREWEAPDPMPPALRRSGIAKPPPPASLVLTPPLQAVIDELRLTAGVDSRELTDLVDDLILSLIGQ
jgi:hypothetical protein